MNSPTDTPPEEETESSLPHTQAIDDKDTYSLAPADPNRSSAFSDEFLRKMMEEET